MTSDDTTGLAADSGERYERGARIATGGMGEVWRARDTVLGREVAVKVLKQEFADDPTFRARFEAEARHAAGLHHPGIASVFDYGVLADAGTPYLVMELVEGKPLSELLASGQPFDPEQARAIALQVADALAVAHAAGVVHRDVKPANLLVTPDGQVKITDFGIARAVDSVAYTQTGQIVGTPHYLSPEQARGESATSASDVYALGVVLFECLAGRRPFVADTPIATALAHIREDVPALPDSVPADLAAVVQRALVKDPAERYADGSALAAALRGSTVPAAPESTQLLAPVAAPLAASATEPVASAVAEPVASPVASPVAEPVATRETTTTGSRVPLYAAGLLVLAVLVALLVTQPWDQGADSGTPGDVSSQDSVRVRPGAYIGEPVEDVRKALDEKGLKTKTERQDNPGDQEAGTVAALDPTGTVEKGTTITLTVWGAAPSSGTDEQSEDDKAAEKAQKEADKAAEEAKKEADKAAEKASKDAQPTPSQDPSPESGTQTPQGAPSQAPATGSGRQGPSETPASTSPEKKSSAEKKGN